MPAPVPARARREPATKRALAFVDGQNLYHHAREAFGRAHPDYDVEKLAAHVARENGWRLEGISFYTGVPEKTDDWFWHLFWANKLAAMGRQRIRLFARPLRYCDETVKVGDDVSITARVAREKGIDVRIAIDVLRSVLDGRCDVVLVFSQDQDLSEVADEVRTLAAAQGRWIKVASAFPVGPRASNPRGINGTDWIPISAGTYASCIDPADYRPRPGQ